MSLTRGHALSSNCISHSKRLDRCSKVTFQSCEYPQPVAWPFQYARYNIERANSRYPLVLSFML